MSRQDTSERFFRCPDCKLPHEWKEPPPTRCPTTGRPITPAPSRSEPSGRLPGDALRPQELLAGRYRVERLVGKGGVGAVYAALDTRLDRHVALKLIHRQLAQDEVVLKRFHREARATASIVHPGIAKVYDFGLLSDGNPFLVMELLSGESLEQRLARTGRLPLALARDIAAQLLDALAEVHVQEIVHRDIKPSNVFMPRSSTPEVTVKLLDFGMSRWLDANATLLTTEGKVVGTPLYMAPEQVRGEGVDWRADLYSVGAVLYEMLAGHVPIGAEQGGIAHFLVQVLEGQPAPLRESRPDVPAALDAVVLRALTKFPGQRFGSAGEMMEALRSVSLPC